MAEVSKNNADYEIELKPIFLVDHTLKFIQSIRSAIAFTSPRNELDASKWTYRSVSRFG